MKFKQTKYNKLNKLRKYIKLLGIPQGLYIRLMFGIKKTGLIRIKLKENAIFARAGTTDPYGFSQIFICEEYKLPLKLRPKLIIDCGANAGYASYYFSEKYPKAKIIAIEPEESNFKILKKNLANKKNIQLIKSAIWSKDTHLRIRNPDSQKWSFQVEEINNMEKNSLKSITINDILNNSNHTEIDILKLDIEGAEKQIFSKNFKPWLSKTKVIIIEFHERYSPGCKKVVYDKIKNYNFKSFHIGENTIFAKEQYIDKNAIIS